MQIIDDVQRIYDDYLTETFRLEKARRPGDGLLGFGKKLGADPCHDLFSQQLQNVLKKVTEPQEAMALLTFIYDAPFLLKHNSTAYWMLLAVHTLTPELVSMVSPEDAATLYAQYNARYPKHTRLPSQNKIAKLLKAQGGSAIREKRGLLSFLQRKPKD